MPKKSSKTLNVIMQRRVYLWRIMKKPFDANYLTNIPLHYFNLRFLLSILFETFTNIVTGFCPGQLFKA